MKTNFLSVLIRILSLFFFTIMLCSPETTLSGASTGLLLWFQTVLPTLLPCMILADFLLRIGADRYLTKLAAKPISFLFHLSEDGCYGVLVGFLCGYPMGAKTTASLLTEHRISRREASYLLAFTNQPSSMFLIGYLCMGLFADHSTDTLIPPMVLGIYGSAILVSFIYRTGRHMNRQLLSRWATDSANVITDTISSTQSNAPKAFSPSPEKKTSHNKSADPSPLSLLETSMMTSFEVMVKIGGYMILFSIGEAFLWKVPHVNPAVKSLLMGLVEMTTGSRHMAAGIALPWSLALCGGVTAFGGLSGFAQTANVLKGSGLSTGHYFFWKSLQGILAAILILLWFFLMGRYPAFS